jgi:hypothetical protein
MLSSWNVVNAINAIGSIDIERIPSVCSGIISREETHFFLSSAGMEIIEDITEDCSSIFIPRLRLSIPPSESFCRAITNEARRSVSRDSSISGDKWQPFMIFQDIAQGFKCKNKGIRYLFCIFRFPG